LNNIWNESKTKLAMHKNQVDIEKNKLQTYHDEDMIPLRNQIRQLLRYYYIHKSKINFFFNLNTFEILFFFTIL